VISVTFRNTTFHNYPVVYLRKDRHGICNGRIFCNFFFQRAKSLRRVAIFLVKVMKTPVIGLKTLYNISNVCCFCLPNSMLQLPNYSTHILVFKIPKTSADQSNKLEILSLIPFVYHKMYLPSSGL